MNIMAFALSPERLRIIEHNRAYYADRLSTPLFELSMELVEQADYLYHEAERIEQFHRLRGTHTPCEERIAYGHVAIMHQQIVEDWNREYVREWNAGQAEMRERMSA